VPVAAEIIRRMAPLLGLRPEIEPALGQSWYPTLERNRPIGARGRGNGGRRTNTLELGLTARRRAQGRITGLAVDSREVGPGILFAALAGHAVHGGEFIQYALRMGAGRS
jgi:hypothetical protein